MNTEIGDLRLLICDFNFPNRKSQFTNRNLQEDKIVGDSNTAANRS
jgi:hypothetical protein